MSDIDLGDVPVTEPTEPGYRDSMVPVPASQSGGGTLVDEPEQFLTIGVGAWRMRVVALRECCSNRVRLARFGCEHPRVLRSCNHRHGQRQAQWRRLR